MNMRERVLIMQQTKGSIEYNKVNMAMQTMFSAHDVVGRAAQEKGHSAMMTNEDGDEDEYEYGQDDEGVWKDKIQMIPERMVSYVDLIAVYWHGQGGMSNVVVPTDISPQI